MIREFTEETGITTCTEDWTYNGLFRSFGDDEVVYVFSSLNERYIHCTAQTDESIMIFNIHEFLQPPMIEKCLPNLHWLYHIVNDGAQKIFEITYLPEDYV